MSEIGLSGTPVAERVCHTQREHLARVIRNQIRAIGNKNSGFQELSRRVFRNSSNGLLGTGAHPKPPKSLQNFENLTQLTRARDLNSHLTLLTPLQTRRLKRGLRPLGALYGPNRKHNKLPPLRGLRPLPAQTPPTPANPHKESPTGISKIQTTAPPPPAAGKRAE
jgi:hypothetical protein